MMAVQVVKFGWVVILLKNTKIDHLGEERDIQLQIYCELIATLLRRSRSVDEQIPRLKKTREPGSQTI